MQAQSKERSEVGGQGTVKDMNQEIKSFRDLRIWQGGMGLVEKVYSLTKLFPI